MTPLEEQVQKNTTSIKTISDSLIQYAKDTDLDKSNENISANTSDIEELRKLLIDTSCKSTNLPSKPVTTLLAAIFDHLLPSY